MISDRWLLPEGVEEVLPPEADRLERLRRRVLDFFNKPSDVLLLEPNTQFFKYFKGAHAEE